MQTSLGSKKRVNIEPPSLFLCPNCSFRQEHGATECPACGIVFKKHLDYIPSKVFSSSPLSTKEISDIRKLRNNLHPTDSKKQIFETLLHCNKEGLLDLAAYHIRDYKEESGFLAIKTLIKRYCLRPYNLDKFSFINWITKPYSLLFLIILTVLALITALLRFYI